MLTESDSKNIAPTNSGKPNIEIFSSNFVNIFKINSQEYPLICIHFMRNANFLLEILLQIAK